MHTAISYTSINSNAGNYRYIIGMCNYVRSNFVDIMI